MGEQKISRDLKVHTLNFTNLGKDIFEEPVLQKGF